MYFLQIQMPLTDYDKNKQQIENRVLRKKEMIVAMKSEAWGEIEAYHKFSEEFKNE